MLQQYQQYQAAEALDTGSIEDTGSFCLGNYGQEASWLALAVQQGLLDPAHAQSGWKIEAQRTQQQQHQYNQAGQQQQDDSGDESQDYISPLEEQSCGQGPSTSCSSLPSIPSVQGFWTQQQAQETGRASCNGTGPKCAGADSHLPPIAAPAAPAAARPFRSSAPGGPGSKQQPWYQSHHHHQQQQQQGEISAMPQIAAALWALQMPHQQPGSTQQQLLEGMQQALSLLEPAQLQQQVQLLLQAQQQSAVARAQQQQQQQHEDAVRIMPWGGEMQPATPPGADFGPVPPSGVSGAAAVLSNLLTASLSTRCAISSHVSL
jgi:hypothetical protein